MSTTNQRPVKTLQDHFLKANIWTNEGDKGKFYNVTITRTYKEGDEYKNAHSFSGQDVLSAGHLLERAYDEVRNLEAADYAAQNPVLDQR